MGINRAIPKEFAVNGTGIPDVDFDVGESYSGYLPISDDPDDENELFFWFFPSSSDTKEKEVLLWLNGGVSFTQPLSFIPSCKLPWSARYTVESAPLSKLALCLLRY